ncbi:MAG: hypothetical protein ACXWI7_04690 [Croceibacterium sp.]
MRLAVIAPIPPGFTLVAPRLARILARFLVSALRQIAIDFALVAGNLPLVAADFASRLGCGDTRSKNGRRKRGKQHLTHWYFLSTQWSSFKRLSKQGVS